MAQPSRYWLDRVTALARERLARDRVTMERVLGRPVLRRANTRDILGEALLNPAGLPVQGRERLGEWLRERYGSAAAFIYPYLGLGPDGKEEMVPDGSSPVPQPYSDATDANGNPVPGPLG